MVYLINAVLSILYMYSIKRIKNINFFYFLPIYILWTLIIGFQFQVGTDYSSYSNIFNNTELLKRYFIIKEYIFYYMIIFMKSIFNQAQSLFVIVAIFENALFYLLIKKGIKNGIFNKKKIYILIFLFLCYGTNFYNQMNIIRQYINIYLLSLAFFCIINRELLKYIFIFIVGIHIHRSFIYIFPLYFFRNLLLNKITKKVLLLMLFIGIIFNFLPLKDILIVILKYIPRYSGYIYTHYFEEISFHNKITKYIFVPFYINSINLLDKMEEKKIHTLKLGIVSFITRIFCLKLTVLNRIGEYFTLFSIFPFYYLIIYYYENKKNFKLFLLLSIIIGLFFTKILIFPEKEYAYRSWFFN